MSPTPLVFPTHEFFPKRAGIAVYVEEMARAAVALGYPTEVWAPSHPELSSIRWPFTVRPLPLKGSLDWTCRLRLWRFWKKQGAFTRDAVTVFAEPGPLMLAFYWAWLGQPPLGDYRVVLHGSEILRFTRMPYRKPLFRRFLSGAQKIGCISTYSQDLLLGHFPELEPRVCLTPGALRHDQKPSATTSADFARDPDQLLKVLTVGAIHPRKGQLAVLEALACLPDHLKSRLEYCCVGPVTREVYRQNLIKAAARHRIRLTITGQVDEKTLAAHYHEATVFVLTSQPRPRSVEGFGLVYLEAAAAGLPCIGHRVGGVQDAVKENETGLLVNPGDRQALTEALRRCLTDPALRQKLASAAPAHAASFSWHESLSRLLT
jgi:phosphatidylinositol alpha-1,6-mannosyltransferase